MKTHLFFTSFFSRFHEHITYIQKKIYKLPHYTRLFSATILSFAFTVFGKSLLWSALIVVIGANIYMAYDIPNLNFSFNKSFFTQKIIPSAKTSNVLGNSDMKQTTEPKKDIRQEYEFWISVIKDHPDYRDAYIQASMWSYQLGFLQEAKEYLEKAKLLDPNYRGIVEVENLLSN